MDVDRARSWAGAGALLAAISLMLPWYAVEAQGRTFGGRSGWEALGAHSWVVLGLALASGATVHNRSLQQLTMLAAYALGAIVAIRVVFPPSLAGALLGPSAGPIEHAVSSAVVDGIGLGLSPTWGIFVALTGATLAVVGAVVQARAR